MEDTKTTKNHNQRKLLFLYPDLDDYPDGEKRDKIFRLVNHLNYICRGANSFMTKVFKTQIFVKSECVPTVVMKPISKNPEKFDNPDFNGVRVCITKYDNISFDGYYKKYTTMEVREEQDISHLISIKLSSKEQSNKKVIWKKSTLEGYDAEITLWVNELERVLSSIMLDIALYHYFNLPVEFKSRYEFGKIKIDYLEKEFSPKRMEGIYGSKSKSRDGILYLPFAQSCIHKLYDSADSSKDLISSFRDMVYKYVVDWVVVNVDLKTISLRLRNKLYPPNHDDLASVLFNKLEEKEINDIINDYLQLRKENADEPIILLLCRNNIADGKHRQKYLVESNMEPNRYINLEDDYVLFDIIMEESLDEEL